MVGERFGFRSEIEIGARARTTAVRFRHHNGPLHIIPFDEIRHLTDFSRDWVMMRLPLRMTCDSYCLVPLCVFFARRLPAAYPRLSNTDASRHAFQPHHQVGQISPGRLSVS